MADPKNPDALALAWVFRTRSRVMAGVRVAAAHLVREAVRKTAIDDQTANVSAVARFLGISRQTTLRIFQLRPDLRKVRPLPGSETAE